MARESRELNGEIERLRRENADLRLRLEEAQETLRAIQRGEVDGLIVDTPEGQRVFTLEGAEQEYRILVEQINEGAALLSLDGTIRFANRRLAELMGLPLERLFGASGEVLAAAADRGTWDELLRKAREAPCRGEVRLQTVSGPLLPVLLSLSPIEGRSSIALVATDLTVQKQSEQVLAEANEQLEQRVAARTAELTSASESLRASKATLQGFYDSAPFLMGIAELVGETIVAVSGNRAVAEFVGVPPEQLAGRTGTTLNSSPELERVWVEHYRRSEREGVPVHFEYEHPRATGNRWLSATVAFIGIGPSGNPRFSFVIEDITERKVFEKQRDQLLEAERAARREVERVMRLKDEFLNTLSHELRTPLSAVLGWARILRRGKGDNNERALQVIETNAQTLAHMIDEMLDVGRIMSGKVRLAMQDADARKIAAEVVEGFRPAMQAKKVECCEQYEDGAGALRCDPLRMRQVVSNLLSNALKFTPEGGRIGVIVRRRKEVVQIIVRDSGQGIAREFLPQLFDKFLQADSGTTRKHSGLGLGLAIVKQIVDLHGGTVRATSAGLNRGAIFVVSLPCWQPTETARPSSAPALSLADSGELPTGLDVLLVDDDPEALAILHRVFSELGAEVRQASSAHEALCLYRERVPALVLSDISMPGEDGYSLVRRIRELDSNGTRTVCVAVTALVRAEDRGRALQAGFDEHLSKLTDPTTIVRVVKSLIHKSLAAHSR